MILFGVGAAAVGVAARKLRRRPRCKQCGAYMYRIRVTYQGGPRDTWQCANCLAPDHFKKLRRRRPR